MDTVSIIFEIKSDVITCVKSKLQYINKVRKSDRFRNGISSADLVSGTFNAVEDIATYDYLLFVIDLVGNTSTFFTLTLGNIPCTKRIIRVTIPITALCRTARAIRKRTVPYSAIVFLEFVNLSKIKLFIKKSFKVVRCEFYPIPIL